MKLVTYLHNGHEQLALQSGDTLFDMDALHPELPSSMNMLLGYWEEYQPVAQNCAQAIADGRISNARAIDPEGLSWLAPVPLPPSVREADTFREDAGHYAGLHFINHYSIRGAGEISCLPEHFAQLFAGPQVAIVIGKAGRNISAAAADEHIAGLVIMNGLQAPAMGPTKGRDFANLLGPYVVTLEELVDNEVDPRAGHVGRSWNLDISVGINGDVHPVGNLQQMHWTFAELISYASLGADLFPGDLICSGPLAGYQSPALQPGDSMSISVDGLGTLTNTLVSES